MPAVIRGQCFRDVLKCCGKFALALIPHAPGDVRDAPVGFPQHSGSLFHTVLLHIGSHGHAVYRLEGGLQGGGVDQVFSCQFINRVAFPRIFRQAVMDLPDHGFTAVRGGILFLLYDPQYPLSQLPRLPGR